MFKISTSELNKHKKISAVFDGGYKEYVSMIYKNLRKLVRFSSVFFFFFAETEFAENQND